MAARNSRDSGSAASTTGHDSPMDSRPTEEPTPLWAVALNKMRDHRGGKLLLDVTLTADEAYAFVQHYLHQAGLLDATEHALRERNARLDHIERVARGEMP